MNVVQRALRVYQDQFGHKPTAAALAPGRVEIMGNHTDYNGGFVLPAALDRATAVVGEAVPGDTITLYAADFKRHAHCPADPLHPDPHNSWTGYVLGVVDQLRRQGVPIGGFRAVLHSEVPGGAGLSSSAALEVATALFLRQLFPYHLGPMDIARLCQRAENHFVGVQSGILDQFSSVFGAQGSLLFLDCLTLEHSVVKMGRDDIALVICDSTVKHSLTGGDYNTRHAECMAAAAHFGKTLLREVEWDEFTEREHELPRHQAMRARHVLLEDKRVLAMREAVQHGDTGRMGQLLAEGHASCRDLFQNSAPEIDFLVEQAVQIQGCVGAKLTGGGWGGCTINLVHTDAVPHFVEHLGAGYAHKTGRNALIYACRASAGARAVDVEEYA